MVKSLSANSGAASGNIGSIPGLGRSPGGGNGNPLRECHISGFTLKIMCVSYHNDAI